MSSAHPAAAGGGCLDRLASGVAARAVEIERARGLPADLIEELGRARCLRMLAPSAYGGDARPLPEVLRVLETLGAADGATSWVVGQIASGQLILAHFPRRALDEVYAAGPDAVVAGAVAPKGRATPDGDGWRVTGQWPFVTGCEAAEWIYVHSMVVERHRIRKGAGGLPAVRAALFPAAEVEILDTWSVSGLCGTGSHDVRLSRAHCPEWRTADLTEGVPSVADAIFRIPPLDQGGLYIAAVAAGIARGAIDDVAALAASGKRPAFSTERLSDSAVFRDRLGEAYMRLEAARALLYAQAEAAWAAAGGGKAASRRERAVLRATTATTITAAARVVDEAYTLAGGTALYDRSPLQRRLRDVRAATQHAYAGRHHFGDLGALLADGDPENRG